jgi:hypothetical protein
MSDEVKRTEGQQNLLHPDVLKKLIAAEPDFYRLITAETAINELIEPSGWRVTWRFEKQKGTN